MIRSGYLLIFFVFLSSFSSTTTNNNFDFLNEKNVVHAQEWVDALVKKLDEQQIQLVANILYLLYANAIIDVQIRQFVIPITRLNQTIRSKIANYQNATKELATLKTLIDRLSYIIGARTIYNQMLQTSLDYYNKNQSGAFTQAIADLQIYGQNCLNEIAEINHGEMADMLTESAKSLSAGVQPLQDISTIYTNIANGSVTDALRTNADTRQFASLITLDEMLKNSSIAIQNTEYLLNTLDASTAIVSQLILSATEIYKQHYKSLYTYIFSDSFNQAYSHTLFGMNDMLPDEYKSSLPHPDKVFEHVLQTIKLYTQIELVQ